MPWGKVWVLLLLLELFGSISSHRMDKIQTCPGVEKNLLGKVPAAGKPKTPWESPRLSLARGGGEEASEEKMKLCRGGNPLAHPEGRAQGLALGWGHSDTAWGISRTLAGLLQGEHEEREQPLCLFVCLCFVTITCAPQQSTSFPCSRETQRCFTGFPLNLSPFWLVSSP